jgi:hypothetical protein
MVRRVKKCGYRRLAFAGLSRLFVALFILSSRSGQNAFADQADSTKSYVRVCITVVDGRNEVAFSQQQEPSPGKSVIAHAVASVPCSLLVTALNQVDGQLAYDWRPQFRNLTEAWQEISLPDNSGLWRWEKRAEPFDFYVLVLSNGSAVVPEIQRLVDAMQDPGESKGILKLQTNKLHDLITQAAGDSDRSKHQPAATVTEIRGVTRGSTEFLWRNVASTVYFDDRNSGLVMFRGGS